MALEPAILVNSINAVGSWLDQGYVKLSNLVEAGDQ
jgi:hypothetical protein